MNAVVVYNSRSGSAVTLSELKRLFTRANIDVSEYIAIATDIHSALQPYIKKKDIVIVGIGGDGTLRSIAAELVGSQCVFAPLPGGTLNHFTKDLGIEQSLANAISRLPHARITRIDTVSVNGILFLNNSSIGLYPSTLSDRTRLQRYIGKWPAALVASVRAIVRFTLYDVSIAGESFQTPFVFIGNNNYDIDALMSRTSLDQGVMSIYSVASSRRWVLFKILFFGLIHKRDITKELKFHTTDDVSIVVRKKHVRVSYDGEHSRMTPPLRYKVRARSLRVLV